MSLAILKHGCFARISIKMAKEDGDKLSTKHIYIYTYMSSLHEVGRFSYRKTHEPRVSLFSFQPTRAKHKKSFNKNAFWFHLEAKKPVFFGFGHWVFVGPTCPLRCCTLFTMAENCSKTSCIQTPRGIKKGDETQPFWVPKRLPHMALS